MEPETPSPAEQSVVTWSALPSLRWFLPHGAAAQAAQDTRILQQQWMEIYTGKLQWRDIPIECISS